MPDEDPTTQYTHGYWLVAFVDLLGQKKAFMDTDYVPNRQDAEKVAAFIKAVKKSVGVIRKMRELLADFRESMGASSRDAEFSAGMNEEQIATMKRLASTRIREYRKSDGIMLACPLIPEPGHFPMRGVYDVIATCTALMLIQMATEAPIRGGLDVGTGMEIEGELFGAGLVKAYELESKHAKYPRLAVGQDFVNYLNTSATTAPDHYVEGKHERQLARGCLDFIKRDSDGQWMIDYAGRTARERLLPTATGLLDAAQKFARDTRTILQTRTDDEGKRLFGRYSQLVRYLDASGP